MFTFTRAILLFVASTVALTSCCTRYKCVAEVLLIVRDDHGGLLIQADGLSVGTSSSALPCPTTMGCSYYLLGTDYEISAAGFKSASLHVAPVQDECGNSVAQTFNVTLASQDGPKESSVKSTSGDSCGG